MHKYQFVEKRCDCNGAFSKAPRDVSLIAESLGFKAFVVKDFVARTFFTKVWFKLYIIIKLMQLLVSVERGSVLFFQSPCFPLQTGVGEMVIRVLKILKRVKIIVLVHDIDEFRYKNTKLSKDRKILQPLLQLSDRVIVHNIRMRNWYESIGMKADKLIELKLFDYITDEIPIAEDNDAFDPCRIIVTSNLRPDAAVYLKYLKTYDNLKWELFGPNFSWKDTGGTNIRYNGELHADELPNKLPKGFGLVWYGDSKETCRCYFTDYLKIINSHKTSAYLAAGVPVIVWKGLGISDYVKEKGIGLCVNSLDEIEDAINKLTSAQIEKIMNAVFQVKKRVRSGYYTREALKKSLDSLWV